MQYLTKYRVCRVVQVAALFSGVFGVLLVIGAGLVHEGLVVSSIVLFGSVLASLVSGILATVYKNKAKTYTQNSDKVAVETLAQITKEKNNESNN